MRFWKGERFLPAELAHWTIWRLTASANSEMTQSMWQPYRTFVSWEVS